MLEYDISNGDGREIALLHAGICDRRMWDPQWATLGERYRALRFDMRGFGNSPLPEDSFSNTIDLGELLAAAEFGPTVLIGCSMGGAVAIDAAIAFPDRVSALVLVCSALAGFEWSKEVDAYGQLEEIELEEGDLDAAAAINVRFWVDGPQRRPDEVDGAVRQKVHAMQRRAFELQIDAPADLEEHPVVAEAREHLGSVRCPVLVVVGSIDRADILEIADQLVAGLPNARLATIDGTAHLPSMERPDEFDELVEEFIDSLG